MWPVPLPGLNALFLYNLSPSCELEHECTVTQLWPLRQWAISFVIKHPKLRLKTTIIWSLRGLARWHYFKLWVWQSLTPCWGWALICSTVFILNPRLEGNSHLEETLITMAQEGKPNHASTFQVSAWAKPTNILTLAKASHIIQSKFKRRPIEDLPQLHRQG